MKILFISQLFPYPPDSGGKIKTLSVLRLIGRSHKVHFVCFSPLPVGEERINSLRKCCRGVKIFVWPPVSARFVNLKKELFRNLFSFTPFTVLRYDCPAARQYLDNLYRREKFDMIWIDHTNIAQYLPEEKSCCWILDEHNIETYAKATIARFESLPVFKIGFALETIKLFFYERRIIPKFDYWLAISEPDRRKLIGWGAKVKRVFVLPVPLKAKCLWVFHRQEPVILFVGSLSWWPNRDGVTWFYRHVWPLIREKVSNVRFWIVGDGPKPYMLEWEKKDPAVKFFGYVKRIEPFFRRASLLVAPLRMGGGIRIKILTAMAAGLPVIATAKAAEGIAASNGREIMIADKQEGLAEGIARILKNPRLSEKLSANGMSFVKSRYSDLKARQILRRILGASFANQKGSDFS